MKIDKLKKQIKYSVISITVFVVMISSLLAMYVYINNAFLDQYDKIIMDIADIKNKTQEIELKTLQNKKYMEMWSKINQNKKSLEGIKVDDINKIVLNLGEKYSITNSILRVSLPENYPSTVFKNETISLLYTISELSFKSYNDVKAIQFVNEFINYLHGYPIITKFEFFKDKDYEIKDYFDISTGKISGAIQGRLIFSWYVYKENVEKNDSTSNQKNKENEKL